MKANILVVEDEIIIADDLCQALEHAGYTVVGPADNAADALKLLADNPIDLALLDINIKGDTNGTELASIVRAEHNVPFMFITSYYDAATLRKAQATQPSAYLVKPFQEEVLLINVALALKKTQTAAEPAEAATGKLFVRDAGKLLPVDPAAITIAQGEDNYTRIKLQTGKEYIVSSTLKAVEQKLPANRFCRIHKSYLVNLDFIDLIEGNVLRVQGTTLPIGKTYRSQLIARLDVL